MAVTPCSPLKIEQRSGGTYRVREISTTHLSYIIELIVYNYRMQIVHNILNLGTLYL
jgi:hypothetical protein